MARIDLKGLVKDYEDFRAIHGVDLSIAEGDFCVFVGPSGCGKSTLLRMIAGLEEITEGDLLIDGERVNDLRASERGLAMVFQTYALYPHMTVRQNLAFGLENIRMPKAEIAGRVAEAARMLQLDPLLDRRPKQLSGGQRQRVAIGRAVVREPRAFLFDEPLSNLDAELRVAMRAEIADLHRRLGNTMVYVTHDQVEAMTMANRIVVMREGRVEQYGAPLDLYNAPANRFVAGFIGSPQMNFHEVTVTGTDPDHIALRDAAGREFRAHADGQGLAPGTALDMGIRPEHLAVSKRDGHRMDILNIEQLGGECYLYGRGEDALSLTIHLPGQTELRRGDTVGAVFPPDRVHLFHKTSGRALPRLTI